MCVYNILIQNNETLYTIYPVYAEREVNNIITVRVYNNIYNVHNIILIYYTDDCSIQLQCNYLHTM